MLPIGNVRYFKIQHGSEAFVSNLQLFTVFLVPPFLKETWKPADIAVCPEGLGAVLESWYTESGVLKGKEDARSVNVEGLLLLSTSKHRRYRLQTGLFNFSDYSNQ